MIALVIAAAALALAAAGHVQAHYLRQRAGRLETAQRHEVERQNELAEHDLVALARIVARSADETPVLRDVDGTDVVAAAEDIVRRETGGAE